MVRVDEDLKRYREEIESFPLRRDKDGRWLDLDLAFPLIGMLRDVVKSVGQVATEVQSYIASHCSLSFGMLKTADADLPSNRVLPIFYRLRRLYRRALTYSLYHSMRDLVMLDEGNTKREEIAVGSLQAMRLFVQDLNTNQPEAINQLTYVFAFLFTSFAELGAQKEDSEEDTTKQLLKLVINETEEKFKSVVFNPDRQTDISTMVASSDSSGTFTAFIRSGMLPVINREKECIKIIEKNLKDEIEEYTATAEKERARITLLWKTTSENSEVQSTKLRSEAETQRRIREIKELRFLLRVERQWKCLIKDLSSPSGVWAPLTPVREWWKIDRRLLFDKRRIKLKRTYGDKSALEYASACNDAKSMAAKSTASKSTTAKSTDPKSGNSSEAASTGSEVMPGEAVGLSESMRKLSRVKTKTVDREGSDEGGEELEALSSLTIKEEGTKTSSQEKLLYTTKCDLIKGMRQVSGDIEITNIAIYFSNADNMVFKTIGIQEIGKVFRRRYLLRNRAIEIYTTTGRTYFFAFDSSPGEVVTVLKCFLNLRPPNMVDLFTGNQKLLLNLNRITELWRRREISNFTYLMELNTFAGRSYNDLSQYPVFPWILTDYSSESIDLEDPSVYRDLSRPIGALNPTRLESFRKRYDQMVGIEEAGPPFLYGSHYSSPGTVLFYLMRLEPYTSYYLELQGGKFDNSAMRLFWSVAETWKGCLNNASDVKELIPDLFTNPEIFENPNKLNFGEQLDGTSISRVILPPWAKGDPTRFIEMQRLALESEYVSQHLHHWIDLIFGYKQTGDEAIHADNLFYYLTYEGAIDLDSIEDKVERDSVERQIRDFGQTPVQLFKQAHPARYTKEEVLNLGTGIGEDILTAMSNIFSAPFPLRKTDNPEESQPPTTTQQIPPQEDFEGGKAHHENQREGLFTSMRPDGKNHPLINIHVFKGGRVSLTYLDGTIVRTWYKCTQSKEGRTYGVILPPVEKNQVTMRLPLVFSRTISPCQYYNNTFASHEPYRQYMYTVGQWDGSMKCLDLTSGSVLAEVFEHKTTVTAVAISKDGQVLITGSDDCTCLIWDTQNLRSGQQIVARSPLCGHADSITSIAIVPELDILVSASKDKTCIVHNLQEGSYLRTISFPAPVLITKATKNGHLINYCSASESFPPSLFFHHVNGRLSECLPLSSPIRSMVMSDNEEFLITGDEDGNIKVYSLLLASFKVVYEWKNKMKVCSLAFSASTKDTFSVLLAGGEDGKLWMVAFEPAEFNM
eukprot:TRINITY_DN3680_c0_g2_i1.p1 TRINITY_DN3680_c0_g2~~TRINITY_DN3680_c0_g2_i1.p1  ORF type:complete len:1361 (+),score=262.05 TRINITY_DN3680_c0_g2_i1:328-4083(+)